MRLVRSIAATLSGALLLSAAAASAQTVDGPKVNWKVGLWGKPRASSVIYDAVKKHVEQRTEGRFTMTLGYESFGSPKELLDILKVGAIETTAICSSYHPEKTPAYTALDLPFLPMPSPEVQARVHDVFHKHPVIQKEFAGWNALPYASNLLPQYEFIGKGKVPRGLDDFKGMRVRAIGGIGEAMKLLGAVPTSVDATEVYTALERGTVEAASFPSTYAHGSYKTFEVGKWYTENMALGTQACPWLFGIEAWNKLPPQYQKLLEEARPIGYEAVKAAFKEADDRYIPMFEKKKLTFIKFKDEELDQFRKVGAEPVWEEWVKKREAQGIPGRELLDLILATARNAAKS